MAPTKRKQRLIFDKVTFTLPIDENQRLTLIERINDPDFHAPYNRKVYPNKRGRYKNNYQFAIHDGNTIEVSAYPINKNHNFLRVEYNPAKLTKGGRIELRKFFIKLLGLEIVLTIYFVATITRLDLTLDVFNMEPNLYIYKLRAKQSQIFRDDSDESNNISSQVIGSDSSNCRITMYNKNLE